MEIFFHRLKKEQGNANHSHYADSVSRTQYTGRDLAAPSLPTLAPLRFQVFAAIRAFAMI